MTREQPTFHNNYLLRKSDQTAPLRYTGRKQAREKRLSLAIRYSGEARSEERRVGKEC